jgi:RNA methyltransferase, TrmH family
MWSLKGAKIQILKEPDIFFIFAFKDPGIMISSSQSKLIRSLQKKKYRQETRLFPVEGEKLVGELLQGDPAGRFHIRELFASPEWIASHPSLQLQRAVRITEATPSDFRKISNQVSPQPVLALVSIPEEEFRPEELLQKPVLAFESIRDPGNLGTILRTADWFGIGQVVCSPDSTDLYNPKVVQSTMGAIFRVRVRYLDLEDLLKRGEMRTRSVVGTFLEGDNLYETMLDPDSFILFGNESHGLSGRLTPLIQKRISIPSFSGSEPGPESLNVATSVAVVCSELRRRPAGTTQSEN